MSGQWQPFRDTSEAPGAIPNGTTIVKCNSVPGEDTHRDGAIGTVVGSLGPLVDSGERFVYCVEWLDLPGVPVWISGQRIRPVTAS